MNNQFSNNKYKNTRCVHAGLSFASKGEAACYDLLMLRLKAGEIKDIRSQASVYLTNARIQYIADFKCTLASDGSDLYVEYKGFETSDWRIKRRLWKSYGPAPLEIWKKNSRGLYLEETLMPERFG